MSQWTTSASVAQTRHSEPPLVFSVRRDTALERAMVRGTKRMRMRRVRAEIPSKHLGQNQRRVPCWSSKLDGPVSRLFGVNRRAASATPSAIALIPVLVSLAEWGVAHTAATGGKELARGTKKNREGLIADLTKKARDSAKGHRKR